MHNLDFQATTYPNGKFASQTMCNEDKTDGFRVCWYESGKIKSSAEYKYGKPDGLYTAWHENGNKSAEINYLDGHRYGTCTLWYKDGTKRSEVAYTNGKMNGLWVLWHKTGQIRRAVLFQDYRKTCETTWYANGGIKFYAKYGDMRVEQDFSNIYIYEPDLGCPLFGEESRISAKQYWTIEWALWYENGQKSTESLRYGYDSSEMGWHENGQKGFEAGKKKGEPNVWWNDLGIKECECLYDFDSDELVDWKIVQKFFDKNEHHIATVIQSEDFDKFIQWEFFDTLDNKLYEYKYIYPKGILITDDELWDVWLNSDCKEFTKILKSIEQHKSVFCKITNYNKY